ncbi:MAG TPA: hypothetical protein VGJ51_09640, partial [Candidatus Angelobacter sp.]
MKISIQPVSIQQSAKEGLATLCRLDTWNGKKGRKLTAVGALKNEKKGPRQAFDRPFEWHFDLCFQQRRQGGG